MMSTELNDIKKGTPLGDAWMEYYRKDPQGIKDMPCERLAFVRGWDAHANTRDNELVEMLERCKRGHYYCDDTWYSCPKHPDGCADDTLSGCHCGADKLNKEIDIILAKHKDDLL